AGDFAQGAALAAIPAPFAEVGALVTDFERMSQAIQSRQSALQASETRFREMAGLLPDIIYEMDADLNLTYANRAAFEAFGYTEEEFARGVQVPQLLVEGEIERAREALAAIAQGQPVEPHTYQVKRKDGSTFPCETTAAPIRDAEGNLAGFRGTMRDITERKRAEEKIRQRTAQLEALRQVGLELTAQLDLDTLLHSIVSRAVELLGGTAGGIDLYQPDQDVLEWTTSIGIDPLPDKTTTRRGEGLSGKVLESGEPLIVDDYQHWEGQAATWRDHPFTAIIGVPVRWGEEFLGVLEVLADPPRTFSPSDAELLSLFATQAAIAIRNTRLYEEARSRSERLAVVNRIGSAVSATLHLDDLMETVYQKVVPTFQADAFFIALYDEETDELDFRLQVDEGGREPPRRQPLGAGLSSLVVAEKRPLLVRDYEQEQDHLPPPAVWGTMKSPASWLGVPMLVGEQMIGVISVQAYRPHAYGDEEQLLLSTIADQVAVAVQNARLYQAERKRVTQLDVVNQVARQAVSTLDLDRLLPEVVTAIRQGFEYDNVSLFLLDEAAGELEMRTLAGDFEDLATQDYRQAVGVGMLGWAAETGQPLLANDVSKEPRYIPGFLPGPLEEILTRSELCMPLKLAGRVIGVLDVQETRLNAFDGTDIMALETLADQIAVAIENARLFQESQRRAEEMAALRQVNLATLSTLEQDQVFEIMLDQLGTVIDYDTAAIKVIAPDGREKMVAGRGPVIHDQAMWNGFDAKDNKLVQEMRETRLPVVVHDSHTDERYERVGDWQTFRSWVGAPLFVRGDLTGHLAIEKTIPGFYDQNAVHLLGDFAHAAAIALENARLYQELRSRAEQLEQRVQERTAQLQAQYARLDAILHSTSDGIIVTDGQGEIIQANPVAETWLTRTLSPEDAARLRKTARELARRVEEQPEAVLELTGLDLELKAAPVSPPPSPRPPAASTRGRLRGGREGGEAAAVVAVHDVSHLKALDRMKSRFTTNISHELRTPITTIKLYVHLMRRRPEKREAYLDTLAQETDHLVGLVEDILQISRIDAGRAEIKPRPTLLSELTEGAVISHQTLAQKRGVTLEHHPAQPGPVALVDPQYVAQALNGLVENSVLYTPEGGEVIVSTGEQEAEGRVWATATVVDTGMGIPEEELPHIFDRFFRGDEPRSMQISGTGLGLAIVKEIVDLHGGRVTVESQVRVGAAFTIWLPLTC
ncbi:MAG: GAF domain-containing protein, partial [Anaerolineae bacterium]|nr:GAF domain-containing protein [Anaerolineae bacterium]